MMLHFLGGCTLQINSVIHPYFSVIFLSFSDLVKCLHVPSLTEQAQEFDCKVFDGAVLVHILNPKAAVTFQNYADNVFLPFLSRELERVRRIDVVWDRYFPYSIKGSVREKRGAGVRRKVSSNTKMVARFSTRLISIMADFSYHSTEGQLQEKIKFMM